ncbi:MAG: hypothetical protein OHK0022_16070 [Roseiflexaceae bacterium]
MPIVRKISAAEAEAPQREDPPRKRIGRLPGDFVRVERRKQDGRERLMLYVGRALWYALDRPARLLVQRRDERLLLSPAGPGEGYAVNAGLSMPRFWADGARDLLKALQAGRYTAHVEDGSIIIGDPREK